MKFHENIFSVSFFDDAIEYPNVLLGSSRVSEVDFTTATCWNIWMKFRHRFPFIRPLRVRWVLEKLNSVDDAHVRYDSVLLGETNSSSSSCTFNSTHDDDVDDDDTLTRQKSSMKNTNPTNDYMKRGRVWERHRTIVSQRNSLELNFVGAKQNCISSTATIYNDIVVALRTCSTRQRRVQR